MIDCKQVRIYERLHALHRQQIVLTVILIGLLVIVMAGFIIILGNQAAILTQQTDTLDQLMLMQMDAEMERLEPDYWEELEEATAAYPLTAEEFDLICRVVASEARSEDLQGQMAVANVILDRAVLWDMTVTDVVTAPGQFAEAYSGEISDETRLAVSNVFEGGVRVFQEPVTHFAEGEPYWAEGKACRGSIGRHQFWY